jgi:hypothetical protein
MSVILICWHAALITIFIVGEMWLIVKIVKAVRHRHRDDPLPREVHEVSHGVRNEATAIRATMQRYPDPIHALVSPDRSRTNGTEHH